MTDTLLDALRAWLTVDDDRASDDDPLADYDRGWLEQREFENLTVEPDADAVARCDCCGRLFDDLADTFDHVDEHGEDVDPYEVGFLSGFRLDSRLCASSGLDPPADRLSPAGGTVHQHGLATLVRVEDDDDNEKTQEQIALSDIFGGS